MPWSFLSVVQTDNPRESNDGPIFWVRPGEQMLPANEALKESSRPKKRFAYKNYHCLLNIISFCLLNF